MFCTPPATTRSVVPDITACAAKCTACCDDPHWRSTVVPGTSSGRPATSQHVRAMSPACGPIVSTQPNTTSSTAAGSTSTRSISARIACAPRSAGWTLARPPLRRPDRAAHGVDDVGLGHDRLLRCGVTGSRGRRGRGGSERRPSSGPAPTPASCRGAGRTRSCSRSRRGTAARRAPSSSAAVVGLRLGHAHVHGVEGHRGAVHERAGELEREPRVRRDGASPPGTSRSARRTACRSFA